MSWFSRARRWFSRKPAKESVGWEFGSIQDPGLMANRVFQQLLGIYFYADKQARARGGEVAEQPVEERILFIARGLMRYNGYAQGMISALRNHVLGANGLQHLCVGPSADVLKPWLEGWMKEVDWWDWEREIYERVHIEGNCVMRFFAEANSVELRPIEMEWITPYDGTEEWTFGFYNEPGDVHRVTALHTMYGDVNEVVDWNEWYQIKNLGCVRADKRGRSDFLASATLLDDSFKTWRNFVRAEAVRQAVVYFAKQQDGVTPADLEQSIAATADYQPPVAPNSHRSMADAIKLVNEVGVEYIQNGTELASCPAANAQGTMTGVNASLLAAGRAYHMPLVLMSGDMSANNTLDFGDESPFGMTVGDQQRWYCKHVRNLLWRVVECAVDDGQLPHDILVDGTDINVAAEKKPARDTDKNTTRAKTLYDDGIISARERSVMEGVDYDEQQAQRRAEGVPGPAALKQQAQPALEEVQLVTVHRGGKTFQERRQKAKPKQQTQKAERTTEEHKQAMLKAIAKFKAAPKPTGDEKRQAKAGLAKLGANKYRRNLVGNTADRRKRRQALLTEFGDGKKCPCIYCGTKIGEGTLEQDKIYTTAEGGRYRTPNLVPSCGACNKQRGDKPFAEVAKRLETHAAS